MKRLFSMIAFAAFLSVFGASAGETAEDAAAGVDQLAVHSGASAETTVLKTLKKGDRVTIEFEATNSEGDWCGILEGGKTEILGYVPCGGLLREQARRFEWEDAELPEGSVELPEETLPAEAVPVEPAPKAPKKATKADAERFVNAAKKGNTAVLKAMLEKGIDLDIKNARGDTALAAAVESGRRGAVKFLIDSGVDVNRKFDGCLYMGTLRKDVSYPKCRNISALTLAKARRDMVSRNKEIERIAYNNLMKVGEYKAIRASMERMIKEESQLGDCNEIIRLLTRAGARE